VNLTRRDEDRGQATAGLRRAPSFQKLEEATQAGMPVPRGTGRLRRKKENQKTNPHGRMAAQGHENAGLVAGNGAGAPPHWFSPEGAGRGIFEAKGKNL